MDQHKAAGNSAGPARDAEGGEGGVMRGKRRLYRGFAGRRDPLSQGLSHLYPQVDTLSLEYTQRWEQPGWGVDNAVVSTVAPVDSEAVRPLP